MNRLISKALRCSALVMGLLTAAPAWSGAAVWAQRPAIPVDAAEVRVESVVIRGNERQPDDLVAAQLGIAAGDRVNYRTIAAGLRRLWGSEQFEDVQAWLQPTSPNQDTVAVLIVEVEEQPFVSFIDFEGLQSISPRTVRDTAGLRSGAPYNPARVAVAESMIRELLANKGIRVRRVEHQLAPIQGVDEEYRLVFEVDEGARVAIAEIEFEGNEVFEDDELRDAMATKKEGFLWFRTGQFDEARLRADIRTNLPAFYGRHGFIDFVVTGDTLVVDPESGKARLLVSVDEGDRYRLVDFDVVGNRQFPSEDLRRFFERPRGGLFGLGGGNVQTEADEPVFDEDRFERATQDVSELYRNRGFLYAQVRPYVERTETEAGEPGVRVGWEIQEGEPAFVNRITIVGNTFTHESVIRDRIFLLPGDVFSQDRLIQSYRSIMGLGFFESPLPPPDVVPIESGDVNVTFRVAEKQTGSINFGTSIGGFGGLTGFIGYDQPNLFGQAKAGSLRWEFGRFSNNLQANYSDPSIGGSRYSGSVSVFSARDRFFRFAEGQRRRTGTALRFGIPFWLEPRFTRLQVGYSISRTTYEEFAGVDDASIFALPPGVQSQLSLGIVRNNLDSPLFPTAGTRQELSVEMNGGVLGGNGNFQKVTLKNNWWVPVTSVGGGGMGGSSLRFALGLSAEAGILAGDADRFPFERFWMGGVQFGVPLRGYDETSITPLGFFPENDRGNIDLDQRLGDAYLKLSAEYALRFGDNLSLSVFGDAGNIWADPSDIDPTRLFKGAGIGAMLVTPFGPLGLDYAYGFDKDQPGWQLHFKFGQGF